MKQIFLLLVVVTLFTGSFTNPISQPGESPLVDTVVEFANDLSSSARQQVIDLRDSALREVNPEELAENVEQTLKRYAKQLTGSDELYNTLAETIKIYAKQLPGSEELYKTLEEIVKQYAKDLPNTEELAQTLEQAVHEYVKQLPGGEHLYETMESTVRQVAKDLPDIEELARAVEKAVREYANKMPETDELFKTLEEALKKYAKQLPGGEQMATVLVDSARRYVKDLPDREELFAMMAEAAAQYGNHLTETAAQRQVQAQEMYQHLLQTVRQRAENMAAQGLRAVHSAQASSPEVSKWLRQGINDHLTNLLSLPFVQERLNSFMQDTEADEVDTSGHQPSTGLAGALWVFSRLV